MLLPPCAESKSAKKLAWADMDEDATTTAGGSTRLDTADTTTVPSDNDDMETHSSEASRMSKSRTAATRGSTRKAAKRAAYLADAKAKLLASGGTWTEPTDHKVLATVRNDNIAQARKVADADVMTAPEKIMYLTEIDHFFAPKFAAKPQSAKSVALVNQRYVILRDGHQFCVLCSKWCDGNHLDSSGHIQRAEETASADEMIGICFSGRRYEVTPGVTLPLTAKNVRRYWGENIHNMPALLRNKMQAGCTIQVQMPSMGKKAHRVLALDDIRSIGLGMVSYPGQGKYKPDAAIPERCVRWDWLEEDLVAPEEGVGEDTPFILDTPIPSNSGWWPVCIISWNTEHTDHGIATREGYYTQVINGVMTCYILCWYQLMDSTWVITAWPVLLGRRSRL